MRVYFLFFFITATAVIIYAYTLHIRAIKLLQTRRNFIGTRSHFFILYTSYETILLLLFV